MTWQLIAKDILQTFNEAIADIREVIENKTITPSIETAFKAVALHAYEQALQEREAATTTYEISRQKRNKDDTQQEAKNILKATKQELLLQLEAATDKANERAKALFEEYAPEICEFLFFQKLSEKSNFSEPAAKSLFWVLSKFADDNGQIDDETQKKLLNNTSFMGWLEEMLCKVIEVLNMQDIEGLGIKQLYRENSAQSALKEVAKQLHEKNEYRSILQKIFHCSIELGENTEEASEETNPFDLVQNQKQLGGAQCKFLESMPGTGWGVRSLSQSTLSSVSRHRGQ